jgi:predicted acylesterase/phospholipase RssA
MQESQNSTAFPNRKPIAPTPVSAGTVEGNDAVCFTAGSTGTAFGAGTIHAYLAADRKSPALVAGISMGALNAAAMQRAYRDLNQSRKQDKLPAEQEAARWRWFRQYLESLLDQPLNVFWDAIPDQSDFFADMVPIRDTSTPRSLEEEELAARRRRYLLVQLGRWLAQLPVSVSLVANILVNYVRFREKYPFWQKLKSILSLLQSGVVLITQIMIYGCLSPHFFSEHLFMRQPKTAPKTPRWAVPLPRRALPFLAWLNRFNFTVVFLGGLMVFGVALSFSLPAKLEESLPRVLVGIFICAGLLLAMRRTHKFRKWIMRRRVVQFLLLPIFGWGVYLVSWFNVVSLTTVVFMGGWMILRGLQERDMPDYWLILPAAALLMILPYSLLLLFYIIPETNKWLNENGLLRSWRRPLFGWEVFSFLSLHVISLALYLSVGIAMFISQGLTLSWSSGLKLEARVAARLILVPLIAPLAASIIFLLRSILRKRELLCRWPKPGVTWTLFLLASLVVSLASAVWFYYCLVGFRNYVPQVRADFQPWVWNLFFAAAIVLFATWIVTFAVLFTPELGQLVFRHVLGKLELRRGLIHDFYFRRKLAQLFDPLWKANTRCADPPPVLLDDNPMPALLVCAPLPTLHENITPLSAHQLWAKRGTPLIEALRAALSLPPLFEPLHLRKKQAAMLQYWLKSSVFDTWKLSPASKRGLDLVDGSAIRQNPLAALFGYLRGNEALAMQLANNNDQDHPAIHVVYRVPIESQPGPRGIKTASKYTIVDVARMSLRLSARRDTQLEVAQTNFLSRLEAEICSTSGGIRDASAPFPIFADEIAPEHDIVFKNVLNPTRKEVLRSVASGCRCTLETLYKEELGSDTWTGAEVNCDGLLVTIGKQSRVQYFDPTPGLPEVCQQCTRMLKRPPAPRETRPSTVSVADAIGSPDVLISELPQLTGERPRIVLVASGGVFRGAFHIGMLAALRDSDIKPDLIVGASVGTLMGGAFGAMFSSKADILSQLVSTFLHVDDQVALTKTLKGAVRELGLRSRSIRLSPRRVRRMVLRGTRADPGFATAGAPGALIDALSDLFMIPHRQTAAIAAMFVAGHVTRATDLFLQHIKDETLRRLEIERFLIGTSLLEQVARDLMAVSEMSPSARQPFQSAGIAFFGTTTNLATQSPLLLGGFGLRLHAPFDYVEAALASSAFPAVFAPRAESSVFPGTGRTDVLFADGGMFDNLPFLPAIEILSRGQRGYRRAAGKQIPALQFLQQRHDKPDLIIAGALNALPENADNAEGPFDTLLAIRRRASSLQDNVKIRSFEYSSKRVHDQVGRIVKIPPPYARTTDIHFVDEIVDAALLPVFPSSQDHLNGTFAFCASTGLDRRRVQKSIADGCYQTLLVIASEQAGHGLTAQSVQALTADKRIPRIELRAREEKVADGECPFFRRTGTEAGTDPKPFTCPFTRTGEFARNNETRGVYRVCKKDPGHSQVRIIGYPMKEKMMANTA